MKRSLRVLAVVAPLFGLGCWSMWREAAASSTAPVHRIHDPESPYFGRSRDLPASGPLAAPSGPLEMAIPIERASELMPTIDMKTLEQPHAYRSL